MFFKKKPPYPDGIFYVDVNGDKSKFRMRVGNGWTDPDKTPFICDVEGYPIEITIKAPDCVVEKPVNVSEPIVEPSDYTISYPDAPHGVIVDDTVDVIDSDSEFFSVDYVFSEEFFTRVKNACKGSDENKMKDLMALIEKYHPEYLHKEKEDN